MIGALVTRTVVLAAWLDDGSDPDATAYLTRDAFEITHKTEQNAQVVEFKVRSSLERPTLRIPARLALRVCQLRYRNWTGAAFDYSAATCPYVAATYWDRFDVSTATESEDECSKNLSGCQLRFASVALPMSGFPGLGNR